MRIYFELLRIILLMFLLMIIGVYAYGKMELIGKLIIIFFIFYEMVFFLKLIIKPNNSLAINKNLLVSVSSLILMLILMETAFMFIPRSHSVGYTKGSIIWFRYYWDLNSNGFRDKEPKNSDKAIFFVGDSFTAGHGIKKVEDRFSNIVGKHLKDYEFYNLGVSGLDTKGEYETMIKFIENSSIKPKIIVLQYFGNDINNVAIENGLSFKGFTPYHNINSFLSFFVKGSHLINYFYWMFPQTDTQPYKNFSSQSYRNNSILQIHKEDLSKFCDNANKEKITLITVIFPFMEDLEYSKKLYVDEIEDFFNKKGVNSINVSDLLIKRKTKDLMVNNNNSHPSVEVNKVVSNEIINYIDKITKK